MARDKSVVGIEGRLGDWVFYRMGDVRYVRRNDVMRKERIATLPEFAAVRENNVAFGVCSRCGKLLRRSLNNFLISGGGTELARRMLRVFLGLKAVGYIGSLEAVAKCLALPEGKAVLKGFSFYGATPLSSVLRSMWQLDLYKGRLCFPDFCLLEDMRFPDGASHARFQLVAVRVNFVTEVYSVGYSAGVVAPIRDKMITLCLGVDSIPGGDGTLFYMLSISFFKEVNGVLCDLRCEGGNVLEIVEVM